MIEFINNRSLRKITLTYQHVPQMQIVPQLRTGVKQRVNCFVRAKLCTDIPRKYWHSWSANRRGEMYYKVHYWDWKSTCRKSAKVSLRWVRSLWATQSCTINTHIPIGIAVRNWGTILLTHNLIHAKKGHLTPRFGNNFDIFCTWFCRNIIEENSSIKWWDNFVNLNIFSMKLTS